MKKHALIIFQKNPALGEVKTRLAKTIGSKKAAEVYRYLLDHTHRQAALLDVPTFVFFEMEEQPEYLLNSHYYGALQTGAVLGDRMKAAFREVFQQGYKKVVIIGTDCPELDAETLTNAFDGLESEEIVIGPAKDGGYYLLGMKRLHDSLFENKNWSTPTVFADTMADMDRLGLSVHLLKTLSDVDVYEDLSDDIKAHFGIR